MDQLNRSPILFIDTSKERHNDAYLVDKSYEHTHKMMGVTKING